MTVVRESDASRRFETVENPFLAFIPFADISEADRVLLRQRQEQQSVYDGEVYEVISAIGRGAYDLVVHERAPNKTVRAALVTYQNGVRYNASNPRKSPRKLFDFDEPLELAKARPFFAEDDEVVGRGQAFEDFKDGNIGVDELLDGMQEAGETTRALIARRLRSDDRKAGSAGACLGLTGLMYASRGENTLEARQTCLGCKAFGSCAVTAIFGEGGKGIRISLSEKAVGRLKRGLGRSRIKEVVVGEHFEPVREAVDQMAQELQELIDPEGFKVSGRPPKKRDGPTPREQNVQLETQFGEALVALVEEFGYIAPPKKDNLSDDE